MDGNYREQRWFSAWNDYGVADYVLPECIRDVNGQRTVPFGMVVAMVDEWLFGVELCEEMFSPKSPHVAMALQGVSVFSNGSASHHELSKLQKRINLIENATEKVGGVYIYANQIGCDGERVYFDGCPLIAVNGCIVAQGKQFSLSNVQVITATINLDDIIAYRSARRSFGTQSNALLFPCIKIKNNNIFTHHSLISYPIKPIILSNAEEIFFGPACWLWDYLWKSKANGFFLPLSGGIDSAAVALIVHSMCHLVIQQKDSTFLILETIIGEKPSPTMTATELTKKILFTSYMKTGNSSAESEKRAISLANAIGSFHFNFAIDSLVQSLVSLLSCVLGKAPSYDGSQCENKALQNIQARLRMVLSYCLAQLSPLFVHGKTGFLLVLGTSNVDESLRGYFTKYDCSSADLNPIGGLSKQDLRSFVSFVKDEWKMEIIEEFLNACPSAELVPNEQRDETEMGFTYEELSCFGSLRKESNSGPLRMFQQILSKWPSLSVNAIKEKVKSFFRYYGMNRHKMATLTPSYHAREYGTDDNRFDLRPLFYPDFSFQFKKMDEYAINLL